MQILRKAVLGIYFVWVLITFSILMLSTAPFIVLGMILDEKRGGTVSSWFLKFWAWSFGVVNLIRFKTYNRHKLKKGQAYIFAGNHNSLLDSPMITLAIPGQFRALGKKEILKMPVFGFIFKYIGVTVDRSSPESRKKSIYVLKEKVKKGIHIMVFPEGTTNLEDKPLLPFHKGVFFAAVMTQQPIAPMAIINSRNLFPYGSKVILPGTVKAIICDPIPTEGMGIRDIPGLRDRVYEAIENEILKHEKNFRSLAEKRKADNKAANAEQ